MLATIATVVSKMNPPSIKFYGGNPTVMWETVNTDEGVEVEEVNDVG